MDYTQAHEVDSSAAKRDCSRDKSRLTLELDTTAAAHAHSGDNFQHKALKWLVKVL